MQPQRTKPPGFISALDPLVRPHLPPGPTPRLTEAQRAQLPTLLQRGAEAFGFAGDVWTTARVAEVIQREFGISYHRAHIGKVLRDIGWSLQKPARRAVQRDEGAIEEWRKKRLPMLRSSEEHRTRVFLDESGFYPLPAAVRTYAPVGKTPVLHEYATRDHLSAIGAITPAGKLFMHVREHAARDPAPVAGAVRPRPRRGPRPRVALRVGGAHGQRGALQEPSAPAPRRRPRSLRRSVVKLHVGDPLRIHPMLKVAARFPAPLDAQRSVLPLLQVKAFWLDPGADGREPVHRRMDRRRGGASRDPAPAEAPH